MFLKKELEVFLSSDQTVIGGLILSSDCCSC